MRRVYLITLRTNPGDTIVVSCQVFLTRLRK